MRFKNIGLLYGMNKLRIIAFSFQIYFDFSGYSSMAIGLGKMLDLIFLKILISHIYQEVLLSFGEGGILPLALGLRNMFIFLWEGID